MKTLYNQWGSLCESKLFFALKHRPKYILEVKPLRIPMVLSYLNIGRYIDVWVN